ncbi:hypothetical protein LTR36_006899 [Oleoguttula mirabilis]|uniref:Uncharacterized protein n=1 Tax=Oleoguttula mirabilis TaxID=1507867 RepID=A0AAV9JCV4_9PEZI|nr:hypothetical protein LTR36_006899 [Oleoguttula mirabilis]
MDASKSYSSKVAISGTVIHLTLGAIILADLSMLVTTKRDPQEPLFLLSSIPVQQHHQGLYTLPILRYRMYMVSSLDWASVI